MKPLELVVPPKLGPEPLQSERGIGAVLRHRRWVATDLAAAKAKRFTPAELAAEDWRRKWTELRVTIEKGELSTRQQGINETMLRFITLPNYDEAPDA